MLIFASGSSHVAQHNLTSEQNASGERALWVTQERKGSKKRRDARASEWIFIPTIKPADNNMEVKQPKSATVVGRHTAQITLHTPLHL